MNCILDGLKWGLWGLLIMVTGAVSAQNMLEDDWEEQLVWDMGEDEKMAGSMENLLDDVSEWRKKQLNINVADSADLASLRCLTAKQIEGILFYRYRNQQFYGISELMLVPELDYDTRQKLVGKVYCGPLEEISFSKRWRNAWRYGRHKMSTRWDVPLYRREGYRRRTSDELEQAPSKFYMGSPLYHQWRYQFQHHRFLYCVL